VRGSTLQAVIFGVVLVQFGCVVYEPKPLDPTAVVDAADRDRRHPDGEESAPSAVTLATVAGWMRRLGPDVREAVATYRTALARARVDTPWSNPGLEIGAGYGFGADVMRNPVAPFGSLSFTIPMGGKRVRADDLDRARAEVARTDGVARHRELYLELRRRWLLLLATRRIVKERSALMDAAARSVDAGRRRVEAGRDSALDVALLELERGATDVEVVNAAVAAADAAEELAVLVGVSAERLEAVAEVGLPEVPADVPDLASLKKILTREHPGLARLRVRYEQAEAKLRFEIARQYPDLTIGPSLAGDIPDRKDILGLTIGITLPVFDRNQKAIAESSQHREEIRVRYAATANRALGELERTRGAAVLAGRRRSVIGDVVLPQAEASVALARRAIAAGTGDTLKLLEAERGFRKLRIKALEAELAEREAWVALEGAVGRPLVRFPGEPGEDHGPPDGLKEEDRR